MSVEINISNYEEFLLSYIDGELTVEENAAVEAFLQQHPAQAKELEVLKAAVLKPDTGAVFGNKEMLYRSTVISAENYEGFLLSYIDGELNTAEQTALKAFLRKHPHLQQELDSWEATRLPSDEALHFDNKEMLYRHTGTLTPENYETYLLSYIDGELSTTETQTLHAFLQQHPQLQETLQLLERTRLQPDPALQMPDKAALYRHTGVRRTIRPTAWWWGAAAAVVAGCLVWLLPLQQSADKRVPIDITSNNKPASGAQTPAPATQAPAPPVSTGPVAQTRVQPAPANEEPVMRAKTPAVKSSATLAKNQPAKAQPLQRPVNNHNQQVAANTNNTTSNNTKVLAQLPQPRATSAEVVQQHMEKAVQAAIPPVQEATVTVDPNPVLAANMKVPHTPVPEKPEAAPTPQVQGELIMSVTSTGESKLLNGVASVAKFFSRKKHQKSE